MKERQKSARMLQEHITFTKYEKPKKDYFRKKNQTLASKYSKKTY